MAGRYKILEQLGAGGSGAVFKAYDSQLNRYVAVKRLLSREEVENPVEHTEALIKEAGSLAALQHPNIVSVYDLANDEDGFFIVMELLEGDTLADWIRHSTLPLPDFYELATQTLEAVLTAHHQSILHRDLKPENIKVVRLPGGRLQAKVLDFGLARLSYGARKMTEDQSGNIMGSVYYMSPEQMLRQPVDGRADLYALGCLYYQALSGHRPFEHPDIQGIMQLHLEHRVYALRDIAPHIPQPISDWVMWLMNREPTHRPVSAQQSLDTLREIHKAGWFKVTESVPMAIPIAEAAKPVRPTGSQRLRPGPTTSQRIGQASQRLTPGPQPRRPTATVPGARRPTTSSIPVPAGRQTSSLHSLKPPGNKPKNKKDEEEKVAIPFWVWPAGAFVIAAVIWTLWPKKDPAQVTATPGAAASPQASVAPVQSPTATPPPSGLAARPPDLIFDDNILQLRAGENMIAPGNKTSVLNNDTVQSWFQARKQEVALVAQGSPPRYLFDKPEGLNHGVGFIRMQPGNVMLHRMAKDKPDYKNYPMNANTGAKRKGVTAMIVVRPDPAGKAVNILQVGDQDGKATLTLIAGPGDEFSAVAQVDKDRKEVKVTGRKMKMYAIVSVVWDAKDGKLHCNVRSQDGGKNIASSDAPKNAPILNEVRLPSKADAANFTGDVAELIVWPYAMEQEQRNLQDWRLAQHYFINRGSRY